MEKKKRSTLVGAALIFIGILAGVAIARHLPAQSGGTLIKRPQGGLSKPTQDAVQVGAPDGVTFSAADARAIELRYASDCSYRVDTEKLLSRPLDWHLADGQVRVLIVHTHASESYTKTPEQDYAETSQYRTLDTEYNMVAIGDRLAALLQEAGIGVLHDRELHDYPAYNSSYANARTAIEAYLQAYPTIRVVLDLHRDAVALADGSQYAPTAETDGEQVAKLMMVVGSDASGTEHPNWEENLSAALKMQALLERAVPDITRPTILRAQRYNQDLCAGAMLVEIGTAGNTFDEAMRAVPVLAQAITALANGTK